MGDQAIDSMKVASGDEAEEEPVSLCDDLPAAAKRRQSQMMFAADNMFAQVAYHPVFQNGTLLVIVFNAIWIGIDVNWNHPRIRDHRGDKNLPLHPISTAIEHLFCIYFTTEVIIRFLAFKRKCDCYKDAWFVFDSLLVVMMVLETWIFAIIAEVTDMSGSDLMSKFSALRLLRLLRLARMTRIIRMFPELVTLLKGMMSATKAVGWILVFLLICQYVFSIVFVSQLGDNKAPEWTWENEYWQADADPTAQELFGTMGDSMMSLFTHGMLADNLAQAMQAIKDRSGPLDPHCVDKYIECDAPCDNCGAAYAVPHWNGTHSTTRMIFTPREKECTPPDDENNCTHTGDVIPSGPLLDACFVKATKDYPKREERRVCPHSYVDCEGEEVACGRGHPRNLMLFWFFIAFMIISAFCLLNMLIGVLCEVITDSADQENAKNQISELRYNMAQAFQTIDTSRDGLVTEQEWEQMKSHPMVRDSLTALGVEERDIEVKLDQMQESLFGAGFTDPGQEEFDARQGLTFHKFLEKVMEIRPDMDAGALDIEILRVRVEREETNFNARLDCIEQALTGLKTDTEGEKAANTTNSPYKEETKTEWLREVPTEVLFAVLNSRAPPDPTPPKLLTENR